MYADSLLFYVQSFVNSLSVVEMNVDYCLALDSFDFPIYYNGIRG